MNRAFPTILLIVAIFGGSNVLAFDAYSLKMKRQRTRACVQYQQKLSEERANFSFTPTLNMNDTRAQIFIGLLLFHSCMVRADQVVHHDSDEAISPVNANNSSVCTVTGKANETALPAPNLAHIIMTSFDDIIATKREGVVAGSYGYRRFPEVSEKIVKLTRQEVQSLYTDQGEFYNQGTANTIATVHLAQARGDVDPGTKIAVRMRKDGMGWQPNIDAYTMLEFLRETNITNYIPKIFGMYSTPLKASILEAAYRKFRNGIQYDSIECTETEFVDGPEYFINLEKKVPLSAIPRIIVEEVIGMWAVRNVARLDITDLDGDVDRHHLLAYDRNYAVYHIDGDAYLFEPGYSPRQVDYDSNISVDRENERPSIEFASQIKKVPYSYSRFCHVIEKLPTESLRNFVIDLCEGQGLFNSIKHNLAEYKISEDRPLPLTGNIKHFYIPDEYLSN